MARTLRDVQKKKTRVPKTKPLPKKGRKPAAAQVEDEAPPAKVGHNAFKVDRRTLKKYVDELDREHEAKARDNASHMSTIRSIKEHACNTLGVAKSVFNELYDEHKFEKKRQMRNKERSGEHTDQIDKLRLAMGSYASSPLGQAALERAEREEAAAEIDDSEQPYDPPEDDGELIDDTEEELEPA